jgi:hypothetical protein
MISKITALLAAALVLASAGAASAQIGRRGDEWRGYYGGGYYNRDYWAGIRGVAPYHTPRFDPYAGTIYEGVAPY